MSQLFWQAKLWGLLHDPVFKALHTNKTGRGGNSFWQELPAMDRWRENSWNPEQSDKKILQHIHLADYITSASDRGAIGSVTASVNYNESGLKISHLLSGAKLEFRVKPHRELLSDRAQYLQQRETHLQESIPTSVHEDIKCLFWWLWRCLPEAACQEFQGDSSLLLMPAETRFPDSSIWNHASLTAALAGALAGSDLTVEDIEPNWSANKHLSHPYLATFSFSPVQELIKASRKIRDFWSGSWILHYLSAKVCWRLALLYGPDSFLYPSLFQQPLIDYWILQKWSDFSPWIKPPSPRQLLTAGFPNVLVLILPKDKVTSAMQTAKQILIEEWRQLGSLVFEELQAKHKWMPELSNQHPTWESWLNAQWQTYWSATPIGLDEPDFSFKNAAIPEDQESKLKPWLDQLNQAYSVKKRERLFLQEELNFLREAYQRRLQTNRRFSVNIGSWWPHIFDQTRFTLSAIKNARTWEIPTAFGPRSTMSGLGPVVHPGPDWVTEGETKPHWQRRAGLFDGKEQLNATEVIKRGLPKVLPKLLDLNEEIANFYPDLTAGVAGYLKQGTSEDLSHFKKACKSLYKYLLAERNIVAKSLKKSWGIPWADEHEDTDLRQYQPRLLNSGWLLEDLEVAEEEIKDFRAEIDTLLSQYYPHNNPTDWYVLAAGDGDGMSEWLKGQKLNPYRDYIAPSIKPPSVEESTFNKFLDLKKRMGPSTHSALSRALLDFSNQLAPYLTERRYAGRLIYGGGDDILAYTNLWEWDSWLWDIRRCFRGDKDSFWVAGSERKEFTNDGDYWHWCKSELPQDFEGNPLLSDRPLFTMGRNATISFGIVIAHQSVPLAIALENLYQAEEGAKDHKYESGCWLKKKTPTYTQKDAVQVRIIYGNGNILTATAKFDVFHLWQELLKLNSSLDSALFEQAAAWWEQHPAPSIEAIAPWTQVFCSRRDAFKGNEEVQKAFQKKLASFLDALWRTSETEKTLDTEIKNWLKLAAFCLRNRTI